MVDTDGNDLGAHAGIEFFTIGQRRALGIERSEPGYVVAIDADTRTVVIGNRDEVYSGSLRAELVSYTAGVVPTAPLEVTAKFRYKSVEAPATLHPDGRFSEVRFHRDQRALTPGQAVVFYQGEEVIGGGIIDKVARPAP